MFFQRQRPSEPFVPPKNPFESFLLFLSLVSSLPLIAGDSGSAALRDRLTPLAVSSWGWCLLVGSAVAMVGIWLPLRWRYFGMLLERAGLILVGGAAALYTIVIVGVASDLNAVRYAAAIQTAYAGACFWRVVQISALIHWINQTFHTTTGAADDSGEG